MTRLVVVQVDEFRDSPRIAHVAKHLREEDRAELLAATGDEPLEALCEAVSISLRSFCVLSEREPEVWTPVALFGVARSATPEHGVCWFLSTDLRFFEMKAIRKATPAWLAVLGKGYKVLHNLLDKRNSKHFRWCLDAGFQYSGEQEVNGHPFIHITRNV